MTFELHDASPQAKKKITSYVDTVGAHANDHHRIKYPFDELTIGKCFTVPFAEANETSLRLTASVRGKNSGKKFAVIKHNDLQIVEVARIA